MLLVSFIRLLIKDTIFQDCWMSHNRTSDGQLQPDPTRFPSGMKALGDYVSMLFNYHTLLMPVISHEDFTLINPDHVSVGTVY